MPSRRGNEFGDVEPRAFGQQNSKAGVNTDTIGLREHLKFMLAHPERFQGSVDLTVELPATEYLQTVVAAIDSPTTNTISEWVAEAIRQRLNRLEEFE